MQKWGALLALVGMLLIPAIANADDAATIDEIEAASDGLNQAFQRQDEAYIKENTTDDHMAMFALWSGPKPIAENLELLGDLKMKQTILSGPDVKLLAPKVAMRTSTMKLEGEYQGKPLEERVYKVQIMVKRNGKWLEKFYQSTILD